MQPDYEFTQNWFAVNEPLWVQFKGVLPPKGQKRCFLEVGSFEGTSATWMVQNLMEAGDELVCVDTWGGGEEHTAWNMSDVEARFDRNIAKALKAFPGKTVVKVKGKSAVALSEEHMRLAEELNYQNYYDLIYIDGSHAAPDVLADAVLAWQILKPEGILVFDDYAWNDGGNISHILHRPKIAIDAFLNIYAERLDIIYIGGQIVVKKKAI